MRTLAVRRGRRLVRRSARVTHRVRMMPSFLIVGAQRCGTTSLHRAIARHPGVVPPAMFKGVHYFDVKYGEGLDWYRGHFPVALAARLSRAGGGAGPITGEASPYYMFHPAVPERIARDLPDAKLIVMLRDPVERAYSAYTHEFARGYEAETFVRALDLEDDRLAGEEERLLADPTYLSHAHQHQAYTRRGHYADQLLRLRRFFPAERIHVLDSARFFARPEEEYERVLGFLGLPSFRPAQFERANGRARSDLAPHLRERLQAHFQPHDERLADLLGAVPSWRR
jgi:hypothetical protein